MIRATARVVFAAGAVLLFCACQPALLGRPAWLVTEQEPDFPPQRYLLAAAGAENPTLAEEKARRLLLDKLAQTLLAAEENRSVFSKFEPDELAALFSNEMETLRRWSRSDGLLHAALVGVEKSRLERVLIEGRESLSREGQELLKRATDLVASGDIMGGVRLASEACLKIVQAGRREMALAHMSGRPPLLGDAPAELSGLRGELAKLEFRLVKGESQRRRSDGRLGAPVLLGVYRLGPEGKLPAQGIPLSIEPPAPAPAVSCVTSDLGLCQVELQGLPDLPAAEARVAVRLAAFPPEGERPSPVQRQCERWLDPGGPQLSFSYLPSTLPAVRAMLLLEAPAGLRVRQLAPFTRHLEKALSGCGLELVPREAAADDLAMIETLAEAPEAVRQVVDYAVTGQIVTSDPRRLAEAFHFCRAQVRLLVTKTVDGTVLLELERQRQAAGRDSDSACRRALEALARDCAKALESVFNKEGALP